MIRARHEVGWVVATLGVTMLVWAVLRLWLFAEIDAAHLPAGIALVSALRGTIVDLAVAAWLVAPWLIVSAISPNSLRQARLGNGLRWSVFAVIVACVLFSAIAEIVFFDEFSDRFNFIAVDYLVYTREVLGNIWESYPVVWVLLLVLSLTGGIVVLTQRNWRWLVQPHRRRDRLRILVIAVVAPFLSWQLPQWFVTSGDNAYAQAIAGNGWYGWFAAYRHNELDYRRYYVTESAQVVAAAIGRLGDREGSVSATTRSLPAPWLTRPKNVVLITVESLSASYLGSYGNPHGLTPAIDALAAAGLRFSEFFAVGTRTVRGLEALSLGIPPLPGQSIVRRKGNENLVTLGALLRQQGYTPVFVYGGYGYFDNMNAYFARNGYEVLDRTDFPAATIAGENIWGVADESLFDNVLRQLDRLNAIDKPFLAHVMTTSNHRPYTFPAGRIELAPGHRTSAVRYSDFAIGRFIDSARQRPWFGSTLFVITADHCAAVAGQTRLPLSDYHVPLVFYGPAIVARGVDGELASQIDIVPTILDLLGVAGADRFYGRSLLASDRPERAFVSNYQDLGYYRNGLLTVLSPNSEIRSYRIDGDNYHATPVATDPVLLSETVASYQSAADDWRSGALTLANQTHGR